MATEKEIENRKRCLACKYYGMNVCPLLANADTFKIDKCVLDNEAVRNLKENTPEWFMFTHNPVLFLRYLNYCRKEKLPQVGAKVVTLRPGFHGMGGDTRYVVEVNDKYITLSDKDKSFECISTIDSWYYDFFEI